MVKPKVPAMVSAPPGTPGRLEERIVWSKCPIPTVNGNAPGPGDVSTNEPVAAALASPTISADTGVVALRPVTPRTKDSAAPEQVVVALQVIVPDALASEPVKPKVKPVIVNGFDGTAAAVNVRIDAAEAVTVPNRMHVRSAAALVNLFPLFMSVSTFLYAVYLNV